MDKSFLRLCVGALALSTCSALTAQNAPDDLVFDSQSLELDAKSNLFHLTKPRITVGDTRIEADEAVATDIDFDAESEWQFKGHVRIEVDGAVLQADSAVFAFNGEHLTHGDLHGSPASVDDRSPKRKEPVRGSASNLRYDYAERSLQMSGNISLNKGQNVIRGCDLTYDFDDERLTSGGSSDCGEPLRVTIQRQETANGADSSRP
jgi:lipopolysaccharide transport protein LptA